MEWYNKDGGNKKIEEIRVKVKGKSGSSKTGRTIFVDSVFGDDKTVKFEDESKPAKTISVAYDLAAAQATADNPVVVFVRPGKYTEISPLMLQDFVTLSGAGKDAIRAAMSLDGSNVNVNSNIENMGIISNDAPILVFDAPGNLAIENSRLIINNSIHGIRQKTGTVRLIGNQVDYQFTKQYNPNLVPSVFFIGGGTEVVNFDLNKNNITVNFGNNPISTGQNTTVDKLPAYIRTINPSQVIKATIPVTVTATYNNYTLRNEISTVVFTRYTSIVDYPAGTTNADGLRQLQRLSHESHYHFVNAPYDPNTCQVTTTSTHVNSTVITDDLDASHVNLCGFLLDITPVNKNAIPTSFAHAYVTGDGATTTSLANTSGLLLGPVQSIEVAYNEILGLSLSLSKTNKLNAVPQPPSYQHAIVTHSSHGSKGFKHTQNAAIQSARQRPDPPSMLLSNSRLGLPLPSILIPGNNVPKLISVGNDIQLVYLDAIPIPPTSSFATVRKTHVQLRPYGIVNKLKTNPDVLVTFNPNLAPGSIVIISYSDGTSITSPGPATKTIPGGHIWILKGSSDATTNPGFITTTWVINTNNTPS
jgi:hypothetical protein